MPRAWPGCLPVAGWGLMPSGPAVGLLLCLRRCRLRRPWLCLVRGWWCRRKRRWRKGLRWRSRRIPGSSGVGARGIGGSNRVKHKDKEWRNMLWDEQTGHLAVIDLEDVEWVKRRPPLQSKPENTQGEKPTQTRKTKKRCLVSASSRDGGALESGIC
ncbi:peptidase family M20/M25/M40 protein [Histoplasma capsulatum G186AR]|uniref:Peptidase family M20/M25/M40 protein n=1 Tax=Ajellomyces capsulatus TaxID=5037 RepID=A0A8H7Z457_AJECA|nr:peptidase family M20/M25/M40 protein [Histoplasma capsulatum]QSS69417.1 peptidase family M20/M25/M40 protein [Histoplasma capsulatum G186AR]